ncbi:TPA: helix-turn-helix domain-containing protein [Mannheimia haemolytica]|nr:helix-turn-helix domain-containing protein [Mannheimia haemolytica]
MATFSTDETIERMFKLYSVRTMKELGEALSLKRGAVSNWNVRQSIPFEVLLKVAEEKNVSLDWLVYGKEKQHQLDTSERMLLTAFADLDDSQKMQAVLFLGNLASSNSMVQGGSIQQQNGGNGINLNQSSVTVEKKSSSI